MLIAAYRRAGLPLLLATLFLAAPVCSHSAEAAPFVLRPGMDGVYLGQSAAILEDKSRALDVERVSSPAYEGRFVPATGDVPSFGYTSSAFWVRFTTENPGAAGEWYLMVDLAVLDYVDLYAKNAAGGFDVQYSGDARPFSGRGIPGRSPVLRIASGPGAATWYLRICPEPREVALLPMMVFSPTEYYRHAGKVNVALGLYFGVLLAAFLYNLFLYFSLRDAAYGWYLAYLAALALVMLGIEHTGMEFIWPDAVWTENTGTTVMMCLALLLSLQFNRVFLSTATNSPRFDRFLYWLIISLLAAVPVAFYDQSISNMFVSLALLPTVFVVANAFMIWRRGVKHARFFIMGWSFAAAGGALMALRNFALAPDFFLSRWGLHIGTGMEAVLFSLALADRINTMKEREEALARDQKVAVASAVLKDKFITLVSHDLKGPLATAESILAIMRDDVRKRDLPRLENEMEGMKEVLGNMGDLVASLLKTSRFRTGEIAPEMSAVRLHSLCGNIAKMFEVIAKQKGITIVNAVPDGAMVPADEALLREAVQNLVLNGVKFSRAGAVVTMLVPEGGKATLAVADTGVGIGPDRLGELFEYEVKTSTTGTGGEAGAGLGLPLSRDIILAHGGTIWAESEPGRGSVFYISLPSSAVPPATMGSGDKPRFPD